MTAVNTSDIDDKPGKLSAVERRRFIVRHMRSRGILSYARLFQASGHPPYSSVLQDIEQLNELGFAIEPVNAGGRSYLVDASSTHLFTKDLRAAVNSASKNAIGIMAASLLLGIPSSSQEEQTKMEGILDETENKSAVMEEKRNRKMLEERNPELRDFHSKSEIIAMLRDQGAAAKASEDLIRKLISLWKCESVSFYADAGTTNEKLITALCDVTLPTVFSSLRSLTACTNSRTMFETLGKPEFPIRTIMVGGTQIGLSEAVAGPLSEDWLAQSNLEFAIAFAGTTLIDLERRVVMSDSQEEKVLKSLAFGRSQIKVLTFDTSKCEENTMRDAYFFAQLDPSQIDLIITAPPSSRKGDERKAIADLEWHKKCIGRFRELGIPVISISPRKRQSDNEIEYAVDYRCRIDKEQTEDLMLSFGWTDERTENQFVNVLVKLLVEDLHSEIKGEKEVLKVIKSDKAHNDLNPWLQSFVKKYLAVKNNSQLAL